MGQLYMSTFGRLNTISTYILWFVMMIMVGVKQVNFMIDELRSCSCHGPTDNFWQFADLKLSKYITRATDLKLTKKKHNDHKSYGPKVYPKSNDHKSYGPKIDPKNKDHKSYNPQIINYMIMTINATVL